MSNYIKITREDGTTIVLNKDSTGAQETLNSLRPNREQVPEMWTQCEVSYKGFNTSLRSRLFNNQKKIEILYNGNWINLDIESNPNLSALIIDFYNNNIAIKK